MTDWQREAGMNDLRDAAQEYFEASLPILNGYPLTDSEQQRAWERLREANQALRAALGAARPSDDLTGLREALDILDVIDGIVDDTHPEGDGCPLCAALTDLRAALAAEGSGE